MERAVQIKVITYSSPGQYARDLRHQQQDGWQPVDSVAFQQRRNVAELAVVPLALVRGRKNKLVITYQRVSEYPDTFSGRMQEATARLNARKATQEQHIADIKAADPTSRIGEKIGPKWLGIRRLR